MDRKHDWNSYVIANYFPSTVRNDFYTVNWFNVELSRIALVTKEVTLGEGKMEFWSDSLNKIFENRPIKEPVSICLHQACKNSLLPKSLLLKLVNLKKAEISTQQTTDLIQFENFAENTRGTLLLLNLHMLRIDYRKYPAVFETAMQLGKCLGMLDYIRMVPATLRKYKLFLPADIMAKVLPHIIFNSTLIISIMLVFVISGTESKGNQRKNCSMLY